MEISSLSRFYSGILMLFLAVPSHAQNPDTCWRLRVKDLKQDVKVEATIRLTSATAAESCMSGNWKRVVVAAKTAEDEAFFPLSEPLVYDIERGLFSLGRTKVCDDYLFLNGRPNNANIKGTYDAVSVGYAQKLGAFTLKKFKPHGPSCLK